MRFRSTLKYLFAGSALLLAGCDSPVDSDRREYTLASVDGEALPAPFTLSESGPTPVFDVVNGSLVLNDDGTATETWTLRCRTELPEGVQCLQDGDQAYTRSGTHTGQQVNISERNHISTSTLVSRGRVVLIAHERGGSTSAELEYVR